MTHKKTKRVNKKISHSQTKKNKPIPPNHKTFYGGTSNSRTKSTNVCNKDINNLLIGEFRTSPNMLGSDPRKFANDIKKDANVVKNVVTGNWLSLPGPPPKFPTCNIM